MGWESLFSGAFSSVDPGTGSASPIPPIVIHGVSNGATLLVRSIAEGVRPSWWLAAYVDVLSPLPGMGSPVSLNVGRVGLNQFSRVDLPRFPGAYDLCLRVPDWIPVIHFELWQWDPMAELGLGDWLSITGDLEIEPERRYFVDSPSLVQLSLPQSPVVGDRAVIVGANSAFWRLLPSEGVVIQLGDLLSQPGPVGRVGAMETGCSLTLVFKSPGVWVAESVVGNFEVV